MANEVNITITGEDLSGPAFDSAMRHMVALRAEAALLGKTLSDIGNIKINTDDAQASLIALRSKMQALGIADIADVNVQPGRITTQLQLLKRLINQAGISDILDMNVNPARLESQLGRIAGMTETIPVKFDVQKLPSSISENFSLGVSDQGLITANSLVDELRSRSQAAAAATDTLTASVARDSTAAQAMANALATVVAAQTKDAAAAQKDVQTTEQSIQALLAAAAAAAQAGNARDAARLSYAAQTAAAITNTKAAQDNASATVAASLATRLMTNAIAAGIPMYKAGGAGWGFLTGGVHLFGGAMDQLFPQMPVWVGHLVAFTANWHLLAEAIIETAGTLIPAIIAFGTFAAVSIPTFKDLWSQLQSVNSANNALNESVRPLTGGFQAMAAAVKPEVYTLAGEALYIAGKNTGVFAQIATSAGKVLDDLGARFAYAITQGGTFGTIAQHAAADLNIWGTGIGNIGGIIGNLLKVLPGYAQIIGNAFDSVTHAIESVTGSGIGQWILSIGLAAHGAIVYIGLLATAFALLATRGLAGLASLLLNAALGLERIGATGAAAAMTNFAASAESAAALPWGWISVAAAAVAFFAFKMLTAKDALQQFFATMQTNLQNSSVTALAGNLSTDIDKTAQSLANATSQVKMFASANQAALNTVTDGFRGARAPMDATATEYQTLLKNESDYANGLSMLKSDQDTVNQHIQQAAGIFGSAANAWAVLNAAGVTSSQIMSKNAQTWGEALIEAQAYNDVLLIGTGGSARYTAALNALNFQAGNSKNALGQVTSAMQALTQAEDAVTNTLLGGEQAFVSFQQTIVGTMGQGGKAIGGLANDAAVAGAKIGGLNTQSLQLAGDYYSQAIPAAQKMIDSLNAQDVTTGNLTKVVATMSGQLLSYAGNNEAARIAIVDLINNALGPGTVSLQNLNTWVKNNSTSLLGMASIVDKTMIAASNLANVLQQDLNAQFQQALLKSSGASQQIQILARDITQTGTNSSATAGARQQLIRDLENTGMNAQQATNYVAGLMRSIESLHGKTVSIQMNGQGLYTISGTVIQQSQGAGGSGNAAGGLAAGGFISMGTGPTADDVPIMASQGEYVVRASSVSKYGTGMMNAINAGTYASGGFVGNLTPGYIQGMYSDFYDRMLGQMISSMQESMFAAEAAAQAAAAKNKKAAGGLIEGYKSGGSPHLPVHTIIKAATKASHAAVRHVEHEQHLAHLAHLAHVAAQKKASPTAKYNQEYALINDASTRYFHTLHEEHLAHLHQLHIEHVTHLRHLATQSRSGTGKSPTAQYNQEYALINNADTGYLHKLHEEHLAHLAHLASPAVKKAAQIAAGLKFDTGGWLQPGWNPPVYNGTGAPEHLLPSGVAGGPLKLEIDSGGTSSFEQFMIEAIRNWVRVKGGGNVQKAFGRN